MRIDEYPDVRREYLFMKKNTPCNTDAGQKYHKKLALYV